MGCVLLLLAQPVLAQNGQPCYKPLTGSGKVATPLSGGLLCVNCGFVTNTSAITDLDPQNAAVFNTAAGLVSQNGISVKDTVNIYPAGYHAGFVMDLGGYSLLTADVLSGFELRTFNNGLQTGYANPGSLLTATAAGLSEGKLFLSFITSQPFNEVRLQFTSAVTALSTFRVYYAMAFDPNCGTAENNAICDDQFAGIGTDVTFSGGPANALTTVTNPGFIIDGKKNTAATVTVPAGVGVTGKEPYVGVLDRQQIFPAGNTAGFVIRTSGSLLSADVLGSIQIRTFLRGVPQESKTMGEATGVSVGVLSGTTGNSRKKLAITTTKPFNELRLVFAPLANVNVGSVEVFYAFEGPATCTDCEEILNTATPATMSSGVIVTGVNNTPNCGGFLQPACEPWTSTLGICVDIFNPIGLHNEGNVVTTSTTDYASVYAPLVGVGCGGRITVRNSGATANADTFRRGTFAGFAIQKVGSVLDVDVLGAITIRAYNGTTLVGTATGASLAGAGLLSNQGAPSVVGFAPAAGFNRIQIEITNTLGIAVLGGEYRVFYAFVKRDTDGDGVPDCLEQCGPGADDSIDTDGDGIPDACDNTKNTIVYGRVLLQGALSGQPGVYMRDDLRSGGLLPGAQPYNSGVSPRFAQVGGGGTEVAAAAILAPAGQPGKNVVDWVFLEFRLASNPATVVRSVSALVLRDGDIVSAGGGGPIEVSLPPGNFYLSVKHRNHLGTMTATAAVESGTINIVDFTTRTAAQLYNKPGGDGLEQAVINGVNALRAGDVNADGQVYFTAPANDRDAILSILGGNQFGYIVAYSGADVNLDAQVYFTAPGNDRDLLLALVLMGSQFGYFEEQLP